MCPAGDLWGDRRIFFLWRGGVWGGEGGGGRGRFVVWGVVAQLVGDTAAGLSLKKWSVIAACVSPLARKSSWAASERPRLSTAINVETGLFGVAMDPCYRTGANCLLLLRARENSWVSCKPFFVVQVCQDEC